MDEEYNYLKDFRGIQPLINGDVKQRGGGCHRCKVRWVDRFSVSLEYSTDLSYAALCVDCFTDSKNVTLEEIIKYYTTRYSFESSFSQFEYNWMLDSIEKEIHRGALRDRYLDYLTRKRDTIIDELLK